MSFESIWSYDKLWLKSKAYIQRAFAEDRETDMFPFWAAIALEFIARATLAKVHPVLLADPREGEHILYVFGYQKKPNYVPVSVPTKTVLERLEMVVPNFTQSEKEFCREITIRRNEELHSGALGFDNYSTRKWLSKYFKTLQLLLQFQQRSLADFLGKDEADAAEEMIKDRATSLEKTVRDRIAAHAMRFTKLADVIKQEQIAMRDRFKWTDRGSYKKDELCPACGYSGVISGKLISTSDGKAGESEIIQHFNILPTKFKCYVCDLELSDHQEMDVVHLGGQYKIEEMFDPKEYYDLTDEPDFDYGND